MHRRIAIVDDSPEMIDLLRDVLEDRGFDVVTSGGERDLVEDLVAAAPDAIILDLLFPGPGSQLSGWDHLQLIRSHDALRQVPVLVCSGDVVALRKRADDIRRDPLTDVIEKPFSLETLERAVLGLIPAESVPKWDDLHDLVLVADRDARLVHASSAMLSVLGLDSQQLKERRVADIVAATPDWTDREWQRYLADGRWKGQVSLRTAAGAALPAEASAEIVSLRSETWHLSRISLQDAPA